MLAGVIEIDYLHGARKMFVCEVPDPLRAIANDNHLKGASASSSLGFAINPPAKFRGQLNRSHIGSGSFITLRSPFFVAAGLGENTAQLRLPCPRLTALTLAPSACRLAFDDRNASAIDADIKLRH